MTTEVLASLARGDRKRLQELTSTFRREITALGTKENVPADPWEQPLVVYGAMLGLAEFTEMAARTAVPPEAIAYLVRSSEARRILKALRTAPDAPLPQERLPDLTGIQKGNASSTLKRLQELGLVEAVQPGPGPRRRLELTPLGWSTTEVFGGWGLDRAIEAAEIERLLAEKGATPSEWKDALTANPVQVGQIVGVALVRNQPSGVRVGAYKALKCSLGLPMDKFLDFTLASLSSAGVIKELKVQSSTATPSAELDPALGKVFIKVWGPGNWRAARGRYKKEPGILSKYLDRLPDLF